MLAVLSAGSWGPAVTHGHAVRVRGVLLLGQPLWESRTPSAAPPALHPPAQGWHFQLCFPFPALQSCCENGKGSLCSPSNLGSSSPVFPGFVHSSPTEPLDRALRNHHLVQLHLARHHWGGGGFHPACCWTAGFLYHLHRQPRPSLQNGPRARAALPGSAPSYQGQAEPGGQLRAANPDRDCSHLGPFKTSTSFVDFIRDFGTERLRCRASITLPAQDTS